MKKSSISWSAKQINKMYLNGKISFDYPIQRPSGQWNSEQKSLLIHSLAADYPIPPIYTIRKDGVYYILDGKQRDTNITSYFADEYALDNDTPVAKDDDTGEKYEMAGKKYSELSENARDAVNDAMILNYIITNATDDEIEELFYRLNNGVALTKQQKAKARMGADWADLIKTLTDHPFIKEHCTFTAAQIRRAYDEVALLQTIMLLDPSHELKSVSTTDVAEYTMKLKGDENRKELVEQVLKIMDYLNQSIDFTAKLLTKKVNFPMFLITAQEAQKEGVKPETFREWAISFERALNGKSPIETDYKKYGGQGSIRKDKVLGRIQSMRDHFDRFMSESKTVL